MQFLILFDVRADPVPVAGVGALILLVLLVLSLTAAFILAFVFLLKRARRRESNEAVRKGAGEEGVLPSTSQPNRPNQL